MHDIRVPVPRLFESPFFFHRRLIEHLGHHLFLGRLEVKAPTESDDCPSFSIRLRFLVVDPSTRLWRLEGAGPHLQSIDSRKASHQYIGWKHPSWRYALLPHVLFSQIDLRLFAMSMPLDGACWAVSNWMQLDDELHRSGFLELLNECLGVLDALVLLEASHDNVVQCDLRIPIPLPRKEFQEPGGRDFALSCRNWRVAVKVEPDTQHLLQQHGGTPSSVFLRLILTEHDYQPVELPPRASVALTTRYVKWMFGGEISIRYLHRQVSRPERGGTTYPLNAQSFDRSCVVYKDDSPRDLEPWFQWVQGVRAASEKARAEQQRKREEEKGRKMVITGRGITGNKRKIDSII
jgi:hypothetical protein